MKNTAFYAMTMAALLSTGTFVACNDKENGSDTLENETAIKAVDLGLPSGTKWANMNVGAKNPWEEGDLFAWGETKPKATYEWSNYLYLNQEQAKDGEEWRQINKYQADDGLDGIWYENGKFVGDRKTKLDVSDDAATANWGGKWKTPTLDQLWEIGNNCYWLWTDNYNETDVCGYTVYKAKKYEDGGVIITFSGLLEGAKPLEGYSLSDTHIFLPAVHNYTDEGLSFNDSEYWLDELYPDCYFGSAAAYGFGISGYGASVKRCFGLPVRPVRR